MGSKIEISVGDYLFDNDNEVLYRIIKQKRFAVHLLDVECGEIINTFSDLSVLKSYINPTWSHFKSSDFKLNKIK